MTTNQTIDGVPRACRECGSTSLTWFAHSKNKSGVQEGRLRTHEVSSVFVLGCDSCSETLRVVSADKVAALLNKPSAQPQGEPVAWVECSPAWLKAGGDCATAPRLCIGREGISHLHPAHAAQPAPVALVMPERRDPKHYWLRFGKLTGTSRVAAEEWNACIDEVTRLNGIK